jgi:hypothetical protein
MLHEMELPEKITVSESARAEIQKLMEDAAGKKPRIYVAGFG